MGVSQGLHLLISGRVQGVAYRAHTVAQATQLGLSGWVRNLSDGRVEVLAEGPADKLEALLSWCRQGPALARVSRVEAEWRQFSGGFRWFTQEGTV